MVEMAPSGSMYSTHVKDGTTLNPEFPLVADGVARVALAINVFDVLAGTSKFKPVKKYPPVVPSVLMLLKLSVPKSVEPSQSVTLTIASSALSDDEEEASGSSFNSLMV